MNLSGLMYFRLVVDREDRDARNRRLAQDWQVIGGEGQDIQRGARQAGHQDDQEF